jgi:hypothetical protein
LKRKTSSVARLEARLTNYSSKNGRVLKNAGSAMPLFESIDEADGSPRTPTAIQFTTSSILRDGMHDSGHGDQARVIAGKCGRTADRLLR